MKLLLVFIAIVIIGTQAWVIKVQADNNNQLVYDLNVSQTAFKIQSATLKRTMEENEGLRQANTCLIKYSYRDRCITAIKHSPLPKLVKEKQ